jgi:hypothetical protein
VNPVEGAWSKVDDAWRWRCALMVVGTGVRNRLVEFGSMAGVGARLVQISGTPDLRGESVEERWV